MKFVGIIPARYASSRFEGKPLADICGKPMVQRVYEQACKALDEVYVATDDVRIYEAVIAFGGKVIMTGSHHKSGTDRCYEAYCLSGSQADVIVNIQGDEPFVQPAQINTVKACFDDETTEIATLARPFPSDTDFEHLFDSNVVKVVLSEVTHKALYFSRSVVPYMRGEHHLEWLKKNTYYAHVGMYAYKADVLRAITQLPQSNLEKVESLEQLRWLENGYQIKVGLTHEQTIGIDTPADLEAAIAWYKSQPHK